MKSLGDGMRRFKWRELEYFFTETLCGRMITTVGTAAVTAAVVTGVINALPKILH